MSKYVWAALRGFLFGYFLMPCGFVVLLVPYGWHGVFNADGIAGIMRPIFFSPMQAGFFILGAYFAASSAIRVNDTVRRIDRDGSWYDFITAKLQRR